MGILQTETLVQADGALAEAVLSGRLALGEALSSGAETLAWSLKHVCDDCYLTDPSQADRAAKLLGELAQGEPESTLAALAAWAVGMSHLARAEPAAALAALERALALWQQQGLALYAAQVAALRLKCWALLGRFQEACDAAPACESRLLALGDVQAAALTRLLLADLSQQLQQPDEAAHHYREASARLSRLDDREHALIAAIGLAEACVHSGRADAAEQAYRQAEQEACQARLPALAAAAVHGLALLNLGRGRPQAGLDGLALAMQAFNALGLDAQQAEVQRDLAAACLTLGLWPEALHHHRALVQRLQGQGGSPVLPWLHLQQARVMARAGQAAAARSSLAWAQALFAHQHPDGVPAVAELAQLELTLALDDAPAAARQVAVRARALQARLADPQRAQARLLQVRAHRLAGDVSAAVAMLPSLCTPQVQAAAPLLQAQAWAEAGHAQVAQGQWLAARGAFEQALARFDDLQAALPGEPGPMGLPADLDGWAQQACEARLALAVSHGSADDVLTWLHRQRVRQLHQRLGIQALSDALDAPTQARLASLRLQRHWLQRLLQRSAEDNRPGSCEAWQQALRQVESQLVDTARRARRAPLAGLRLAPADSDALDIPALRRHFRQGRALVAYGELRGRLMAVVAAQGEVHRIRLDTRLDTLADAVTALRAHLDTQGLGEAVLSERMPQLLARCTVRLQALHQLVWAPLQAALGPATDVVIVPCGRLQALPFAALHDGRQWLDERCRLRMAATVSLAWLTGRRAPVAAGSGVRVASDAGLLPAAPVAAAAMPSGLPAPADLAVDPASAGPLPEEMADNLPALPSTLRPVAPSGADGLAGALASAGLVHLEGPVSLRTDNPAFSRLQGGAETSMVPADLAGQRLAARLVVMGASEAERLRGRPGDEQLAWVVAFQRAGAQEVLDSLWQVSPAVGLGFLSRFYAHWGDGRVDTATAMQRARGELRALHPHPSMWAAFGLYGGQEAGVASMPVPATVPVVGQALSESAETAA